MRVFPSLTWSFVICSVGVDQNCTPSVHSCTLFISSSIGSVQMSHFQNPASGLRKMLHKNITYSIFSTFLTVMDQIANSKQIKLRRLNYGSWSEGTVHREEEEWMVATAGPNFCTCGWIMCSTGFLLFLIFIHFRNQPMGWYCLHSGSTLFLHWNISGKSLTELRSIYTQLNILSNWEWRFIITHSPTGELLFTI